MTASRNELEELHRLLAIKLKEKLLQDPDDITSGELNAVMNFLKQNNVNNINPGEVADLASILDDVDLEDLPKSFRN